MRAGVIGLGAMGGPMAENLLRAGSLHRVWNRNPARLDEFIRRTGATAAGNPAELARDCELVILSVSRDADVLEVIEHIAPALSTGAAIVDTSTVSMSTAQTAERLLRAHGVGFLDAPVSGGVEGARQGTLAMMVGGDPDLLDRLRPVLGAIAARIVWMGPTGSGQATKAVNQIVVAGIAQGVAAALGFGRRMGLDLDMVIDVVSRGAAANWFLEHRGPTMIHGRFDPGFKLALHLKDLRICRDMLQASGADSDLAVIETTIADYERLIAMGHGDEDISALLRLR
jgi:3-hydroxyisobutyrate dehydrogenase